MDWITVEEYLPKESEIVLVSSFGFVFKAMFKNGVFVDEHDIQIMIDAWMPVPSPYKRGKHEAKPYYI